MITVRVAVTLALVGLFSLGVVAAQEGAQVARIGMLTNSTGQSPVFEAFIQGLRDLGYVQGRIIVIEPERSGANSLKEADRAARALC